VTREQEPTVEIQPGPETDIEPEEDVPASVVDVTFFVPCYNEERNVVGALDKLVQASKVRGLSYEILVFDDASTDRTAEIVRQYEAELPGVPVRLFMLKVNRGVARNFVEGAFRGRGKYYRLVCGDDIEPLETHLEMLRWRGKADIVVPYFTEIRGRRVHRAVLSRMYTRLVNIISGTSLRYYNGCPLYRRYDVLRFHVEATGFGYQAEFLTRLLQEGRSYVEVPLVAADREGSGSLSLRNALSVAHSLLKIGLRRLRVSLLK
jgi:glycosyltransferase involved in cell wall biosynthesis